MEERDEITIFAETNFRDARKRFGIRKDDRRRHMYILGKSGTGKTTLLENMVVSDILNGNGVGVVDPHGEFAEKMLDFIPEHRINDVIYFNPADVDYPIAFNPIETVDPSQRHLVASGLMGVFKKIWPDVWSARMEYILNNTILALLETPGSTLLGILRMLSNKNFRKEVVTHITDPVIRSFWLEEFARYSDRFEVEAIAPIQNKVGQFASAAIVRNIVGQERSAISMREVMDNKKIVIMNLSKGKIGEDNSKLLGGLLVAKLQLAAMSRVDVPEHEREDFYLYVDEFQNFATDSFANILSEARKYRLALILANQYIAQLVEIVSGVKKTTVRDAIFGNVGTITLFRVGAEDAEFLEKEFEPEFMAQDLVNLPNHTIYLKLMIDGVISRAFSARTMPPYPHPERSFKEEIIALSRERYARPRFEVEAEIAARTGGEVIRVQSSGEGPATKVIATPPSGGSSAPAGPPPQAGAATAAVMGPRTFTTVEGQTLYEARCWGGGEAVLVAEKPEPGRPIVCKAHEEAFRTMQERGVVTPPPLALRVEPEQRAQPAEGERKKRRRRRRRHTGGEGRGPDTGRLREVLGEVGALPPPQQQDERTPPPRIEEAV